MQDMTSRAYALRARADRFTHETLPTWRPAVETLSPGAVSRSAQAIIDNWRSIEALHDAEPDAPAVGQLAYGEARLELSKTVMLEHFHGRRAIGHDTPLSVGKDPAAWVRKQLTTALRTFDTIEQLTALFESGKLGEEQRRYAGALLRQHELREWNFIKNALEHRHLVGRFFALTDEKPLRKHHTEILDRSAATRDETRGGEVPKERTDLMLKAVREIKGELDDVLYSSDRKIDRWLREFSSEQERELFVSLLSRAGLLAAMHKRGDGEHVEQYVKATRTQRDWKYEESNDSSMTFGESLDYVGDEMGRQLPGVACYAAAGVFNNLSEVPLAGRIFDKAATNFRELGAYADEATGADDSWRAGRNALAEGGGNLLGAALTGGAASELAAVGGYANNARKVVGTAVDIQHLYAAIEQYRDVYDQGKRVWDSLVDILLEVPQIVDDFATSNNVSAIERIDALIDKVADRGADGLAEQYTGESDEKSDKREAAAATRHDHASAVTHRATLQRQGATPGALDEAGARVSTTASARRGESPKAPDMASAKHAAVRALTKVLFDIVKRVLLLLKGVLVHATTRNLGHSKRDLHDVLRKGFEDAGKAGTKLVLDALEKHAGAILWTAASSWRGHPELFAFEKPVTKALEQIVHQGLKGFGVEARLDAVFTKILAAAARVDIADDKKPTRDKP